MIQLLKPILMELIVYVVKVNMDAVLTEFSRQLINKVVIADVLTVSLDVVKTVSRLLIKRKVIVKIVTFQLMAVVTTESQKKPIPLDLIVLVVQSLYTIVKIALMVAVLMVKHLEMLLMTTVVVNIQNSAVVKMLLP